MRSFLRVLSVAAVGCALVGAYNVYGDDPTVETAARREACAGVDFACHPRLLRLRRSPFGQVFVFAVGGTETQVDCTRPFLLFGALKCAHQPRVDLIVPRAGHMRG